MSTSPAEIGREETHAGRQNPGLKRCARRSRVVTAVHGPVAVLGME